MVLGDLVKLRTLLLVSKVPRTKVAPQKPYPFLFKVKTKVLVEEHEAVALARGSVDAEERLRKRLHERGHHDLTFSVRVCMGGIPASNPVVEEFAREKARESGRLLGFPEIAVIEV